MVPEGLNPFGQDKIHRRLKAVDPRQVGGAGLEAVGHVGGLDLLVGGAAGAAGDDGPELTGEILRQQQSPGARGSHEALVARDRQGGQPQLFKVDGPVARGLGGVQDKGNPPPAADVPHRLGVLDRAADIGAVGHDQQAGVGTDHPLHSPGVQPPGAVAGDAVEAHPLRRQILEGPHDGVVLHRADQAVVPGPQPAPEDHVQPHGVAAGENTVGGVAVAEEAAQPLPEQQSGHSGVLGAGVDPPVDGGPHLRHVADHGLRHGGGLGKAGSGVVKIYSGHLAGLLSKNAINSR